MNKVVNQERVNSLNNSNTTTKSSFAANSRSSYLSTINAEVDPPPKPSPKTPLEDMKQSLEDRLGVLKNNYNHGQEDSIKAYNFIYSFIDTNKNNFNAVSLENGLSIFKNIQTLEEFKSYMERINKVITQSGWKSGDSTTQEHQQAIFNEFNFGTDTNSLKALFTTITSLNEQIKNGMDLTTAFKLFGSLREVTGFATEKDRRQIDVRYLATLEEHEKRFGARNMESSIRSISKQDKNKNFNQLDPSNENLDNLNSANQNYTESSPQQNKDSSENQQTPIGKAEKERIVKEIKKGSNLHQGFDFGSK